MKRILITFCVLFNFSCKIRQSAASTPSYIILEDKDSLMGDVKEESWSFCLIPHKDLPAKRKEVMINDLKANVDIWLKPLRDLKLNDLIASDKVKIQEVAESKECSKKTVLTIQAESSKARSYYVPGVKSERRIVLYDDKLRNTLLHEMGHAFGLADTYVDRINTTCGFGQPQSIMCSHTLYSEDSLLLPDDINGVKASYCYSFQDEKNAFCKILAPRSDTKDPNQEVRKRLLTGIDGENIPNTEHCQMEVNYSTEGGKAISRAGYYAFSGKCDEEMAEKAQQDVEEELKKKNISAGWVKVVTTQHNAGIARVKSVKKDSWAEEAGVKPGQAICNVFISNQYGISLAQAPAGKSWADILTYLDYFHFQAEPSETVQLVLSKDLLDQKSFIFDGTQQNRPAFHCASTYDVRF